MERKVKHGMSGSKLYKSWRCMKQRCNNPKDQAYKWYGAKGITVCQEWNDSFNAFMDWSIKNGYREGLTIDRKDSEGNYEPSNCRWITRAENTRRARLGKPGRSGELVEYAGKKQTVEEWSKELGIGYNTLYKRLNDPNWTKTDAFTVGVGSRTKAEILTFNGESKPLKQWAEELNIKPETLRQRLHRLHWTVEKALTKKTRAKKQ